MLYYSGDLTKETAKDPHYREQLEQFTRRTGISLMPAFAVPPDNGLLRVPDILEADVRVFSHGYNYDYLPEEEVMANLLYAVFISRWHTMPTHYTKRTGWPTMQIIYTHAGKGVLNMDNQLYRLTPDTLCILDCRVYHYYYADSPEGWDYSFIHFDGPSAAYLYRLITKQGIFFDSLKDSRIERKYKGIVALAKENPEDFDLLFHRQMTSLLTELACARARKPMAVVPEWMSRVQAFIIEHYNENWSVHDLAQMACLSDSRFAHLFREIARTTPMEYREQLRVEHAKDFLANSDYTTEKIAELTGFSTLSCFYTAFSRRTGATPGKYRKQAWSKT